MKRIIWLLVLALIMTCLLASCVEPRENYSEGLEYTALEDGSYAVSIGSATDREKIVIPDSYEGKPVTQIAEEGFKGAASLNEVTIPASVTSIGKSAFEESKWLHTVNFGEGSSLTYIGERAFYSCTNLIKIILPDGVGEIGEASFMWCNQMTNFVVPPSLEKIGNDAFANCYNLYKIVNHREGKLNFVSVEPLRKGNYLTHYAKVIVNKDGSRSYNNNSIVEYLETDDNMLYMIVDGEYHLIAYVGTKPTVTLPLDCNGNKYKLRCMHGAREVIIPWGITELSEQAFQSCTVLRSLHIPASLTTIGVGAFDSCYGLSEFKVDLFNPAFKAINGDLYSKDGKTLLVYAQGKREKTFTVPDGVTAIGTAAFFNNQTLEEVILPEGLTNIEFAAFNLCECLKKINLPDSLVSLGDGCFGGCSSIEEIKLPVGLKTIGNSAFGSCRGIKELIIPDSVTSIGESAFSGMGITKVRIPGSITTIETKAFQSCGNLVEVEICEGVTNIGTYAFDYCSALERIYIPASVVRINRYAFDNCPKLSGVAVEDTEGWRTGPSRTISPEIAADPKAMAEKFKEYTRKSVIQREDK